MLFEKLGLLPIIQKALDEEGYTIPTPIQERSIPPILKRSDVFGIAQTGTGKTAAFSLPILHILQNSKKDPTQKRKLRTLICTPTRELAIQIGESFDAYGRYADIKHTVIFGGVGQGNQVNKLSQGVDVLVATPGRLLDLIGQGFINLREIEIFVLDEADRMLDMGFIHDVKRIITYLPTSRQSLFFSATVAPEIMKLADSILKNPIKIEVTPTASTVKKIKQSVYFVQKSKKKDLLVHILKDPAIESLLVFTRTKRGANQLVDHLKAKGIDALAIHGNKSQNARQKALSEFKAGKIRVLVATDIAARGIDIDELSHVVNFELPEEPETYVHRIGRTGRAGLGGTALSFCDEQECPNLVDIEKLIAKNIPVEDIHPFFVKFPDEAFYVPKAKGKSKPGQPYHGPKRKDFSKKPAVQGEPKKFTRYPENTKFIPGRAPQKPNGTGMGKKKYYSKKK
ncbi:MAG: DEAD/DEAH box helicase [Candidatus Gracilibacteria bacterium]